MAKLALLIGVSEYEAGLKPLPGAIKDIEALNRVLQDLDMGGFDNVKMLQNPEPLAMQEAIQVLFADRTKDDLVLLFFSGHGIKDDRGKLHFTTRLTRKTPKGELMKATAVPANFVQEIMSDSRSKRQIVILDCCFSGAFAEGFSAKDDGTVDVKSQMNGGKEHIEGRVVLTSSTSTQYSFEQQGSELSTYTRYLVEGIETGAADRGDGEISIDELHEYAKRKVQESAPAMKPEIYAAKEGYKIILAKAPTSDPKLMYQRQVESTCKKHRGEISPVIRSKLDVLRAKLEVPPEDAAAIEARVLKPYQDYKRKLEQYEQTLRVATQGKKTLDSEIVNDLKDYQQTLSLRDEDVEPIEIKVFGKTVKPKILTASSLGGGIKKFLAGLRRTSLNSSSPIQAPRKNPYLITGGSIISILALLFLGNYAVVRFKFERLYQQGERSLEKGDFREAVNHFEQAIKIDNNSAKAYLGLGKAHHKDGDIESAISNISTSIKLDEKYAEAYFERALVNQDSGNQSNALEDYSKAIEINSNHLQSRLNRGRLYLKQGKHESSLKDYDEALRLSNKSAEGYYGQCQTLYNMQKYKNAIQSCTKAIENDNEKKFGTYFLRALAYSASENYDAALRDYSQAIDQNPNDWSSYNNRGIIYESKGDFSKALEDFTKAIEKSQNIDNKTELAKIYINRASARLKMPRPDIKLAAEDFLAANNIDDDYAPAWEEMGDLLNSYNLAYRGLSAAYFYRAAADRYASQNQQNSYQRVLAKMANQ